MIETDLIERLRNIDTTQSESLVAWAALMIEAADEIERLRAKVDLLEKEIKILEDDPVDLGS